MAERNEDDQLSKLNSQMIEQFSIPNQRTAANLDPSLKELLEKLKSTEERKKLDTKLREMNGALSEIDSVKCTLDADKDAYRGNLSRDKLLIEIKDYRDKIDEIRKEVIDCLKLHTELYFMKQNVIELITDFKDFNLDTSAISAIVGYVSPKVLQVIESIAKKIMTVGVYVSVRGVVVGCLGVLTAGVGGVIAVCGTAAAINGIILVGQGLLAAASGYITGSTAVVAVMGGLKITAMGVVSIFVGGATMVLGSGTAMIGVATLGIGALVVLFGGVVWCIISLCKWAHKPSQKQLLDGIQKTCQDLKVRNILGELKTFKDEFDVQRDALKARTGTESYVDLNIFMECYKGFKRGLKDELDDPSNKLSEKQLNSTLASQCSFPLRKRFNLSKMEAKELILAIHQAVSRKQSNG